MRLTTKCVIYTFIYDYNQPVFFLYFLLVIISTIHTLEVIQHYVKYTFLTKLLSL